MAPLGFVNGSVLYPFIDGYWLKIAPGQYILTEVSFDGFYQDPAIPTVLYGLYCGVDNTGQNCVIYKFDAQANTITPTQTESPFPCDSPVLATFVLEDITEASPGSYNATYRCGATCIHTIINNKGGYPCARDQEIVGVTQPRVYPNYAAMTLKVINRAITINIATYSVETGDKTGDKMLSPLSTTILTTKVNS